MYDPTKKSNNITTVRQSEFQAAYSSPKKDKPAALSAETKTITLLKDPASSKEERTGLDAMKWKKTFKKIDKAT